MSDLLLTALERLPQRVRRFVVAIGALLALGAVMAALTLTASHGGQERRPAHSIASRRDRAADLAPPAPAARLDSGDASGPPGGGAVPGRLSAVRVRPRQRTRDPVAPRRRSVANCCCGNGLSSTPVERRRRPRVVALQTIGTTPTFVVATAVIDDGGVATYRLRFTLSRSAGRWAVSGVEEG